jgi:hypothetical protein
LSTGSEIAVELAVRGAELTALAAALMLGAALVIRRWVHRQEAARARIAAEWRPILTRVAVDDGPAPQLPALKRRDIVHVLDEWTAVQDAVRGAGCERLNRAARAVGLDVAARRMIARGSANARILAIRTFGHLRDASMWSPLQDELASPNALASFCAAAALIQIDARRAMPHVMAQLAGHEHWPAEAVARLLKEAGTETAREPLRALVFSGEHVTKIPSVLNWLGRMDPTLAGEIAADLLRGGYDDPQIVSKALLILRDASLLPSLRPLARSPDLGVRKNLATAVGELGDLADAGLIVELMGDRVWWVRYRAAQALLKLRGMTPERLAALRASLTDRFARDMLDHVVAEGPSP